MRLKNYLRKNRKYVEAETQEQLIQLKLFYEFVREINGKDEKVKCRRKGRYHFIDKYSINKMNLNNHKIF